MTIVRIGLIMSYFGTGNNYQKLLANFGNYGDAWRRGARNIPESAK